MSLQVRALAALVPWIYFMVPSIPYSIVPTVSSILLLLIAAVLPLLIPKRFRSSRVHLAVKLTRWSLVIQALVVAFQGLLPIGFVSGILETLVGVILAGVALPQLFSPPKVDLLTDEEFQAGVHSIFNSETFLSTLNTVLPRGKDDEGFGLDYIPYLLQAIDKKRVRIEREARYFLGATVLAAVFFSSVVIYFGYILVNEASSGTAKILYDIRQDTSSIAQNLSTLDLRFSNPQFEKRVLPLLKQLKALDPGSVNQSSKKVLDDELSTAQAGDAPLQTVTDALQKASNTAWTGGKQESAYKELLSEAQEGLSLLVAQQLDTQNQIRERLTEVKPLIEAAQKSIQEPKDRTAELIKRLGLGIVVSTFFLALLRYLGGLYKARYEQVIAAQADEFMVRRFYVAFKGSLENAEQRKSVLTSFMGWANGTASTPTVGGETDDSSKQSYELLKELMSALSKKI